MMQPHGLIGISLIPPRKRKSKKKWILLVGGILLVYALVGFLGIPYVLTSMVVPSLSEQLGRPVLVTDVDFNPFSFALDVEGFEIRETDRTTLVGIDQLFVNFQLSSLFRQAYAFSEIRLIRPFGLIKIGSDGRLNIADLAQADSSSPSPPSPSPEADETIPPVEIAQLSIEQGILEFQDHSTPTPFSAHLVPIDIAIKNFGTHRSKENPYTVKAELETGETLSWEGIFTVDPFRSEGRVALNGFHIRTVWEYLQDQLHFEILDGVLDVTTAYRVDLGEESLRGTLKEGEVKLGGLQLREKGKGEDLIAVSSLAVEGVEVDLFDQQVTVGSVRTEDARIRAWRNQEGTINYQNLFAGNAADTENDTREEAPPTETDEKGWTVHIKEVALDNYAVVFEDRTPDVPVPVNLDALNVKLANLTVPPTQPIDVNMGLKVNETGTVQVQGQIGLEPIRADLNLDFSEIALKPFQPYLTAQQTRLNLVNGHAGLTGEFHFHSQPEHQPQMRYEGSLGLHELALIDQELKEDVFTWDSLTFSGVSLAVEPTSLTIAEIVHQKPSQHVSVMPDGTINVVSLMKGFRAVASEGEAPSEQKVESDEPSAQPVPITIDSIQVVDGALTFVDRSVEPTVTTGIHHLQAKVEGVSSEPGKTATLRIEGKVDKSAPLSVRGEVRPLSQEPYTNVTVSLKGMDLTTESPYSQKFTGYAISKGNLSMDLLYTISGQHLDAQNRIQLDQFSLGDHVESPDAVSLPLPLAVALMKDRKGMIDIELPVEGDLNDPEFSFGGVVLTALGNLITKAATSPFALVGGLIGGDEEDLQVVQFSPGSTDISPEQGTKLKSLAEALDARPGLLLEVTGIADSGNDRMVLAEGKLHNKLRMAKLQEQKAQGQPAAGEGKELVLTDDEEKRLLKILYVQTFGTQPVQAGGAGEKPARGDILARSGELATARQSEDTNDKPEGQPPPKRELSPATIKQRLLESIEITDSELQLLGKDRGKRIRDYLVHEGRIPAERIFLIEGDIKAPSDQDFVSSHLALSVK